MVNPGEYDIMTYAYNYQEERKHKRYNRRKGWKIIIAGILCLFATPLKDGYYKPFNYQEKCDRYMSASKYNIVSCLKEANDCLNIYCYYNKFNECKKINNWDRYDMFCNNRLTKEFLRKKWQQENVMTYSEKLISCIKLQCFNTNIQSKKLNCRLIALFGYVFIIAGFRKVYRNK